jgi:hypothetical protein
MMTRTSLQIENKSGTDFTIKVSSIDNHDWEENNRPDHNFQNVKIKSGEEKTNIEDINKCTRSNWVKLTFIFANGYKSSIRFCQCEAVNPTFFSHNDVAPDGDGGAQITGTHTKGHDVVHTPKIENGKFEIKKKKSGNSIIISVSDDKALQQQVKQKNENVNKEEKLADDLLNKIHDKLDLNLKNSIDKSKTIDSDIQKFTNIGRDLSLAAEKFKNVENQLRESNELFKKSDQKEYQNRLNNLSSKIKEISYIQKGINNTQEAYRLFVHGRYGSSFEDCVNESKDKFESAKKNFTEAKNKSVNQQKYQNKINYINQNIEGVNKMHKEMNKMQQETHEIQKKLDQLIRLMKYIREENSMINKKIDQVIDANEQIKKLSNDQIREIKACHEEQMKVYRDQSKQLNQQLDQTKKDIKESVANGNTRLKEELEKKAIDIKEQIKNTESAIVKTTNEQYYQHQKLLESRTKSILENIDIAKKSIVENIKASQDMLRQTEERLKNQAERLSNEEKKNLEKQIKHLSSQILDGNEEVIKFTKQNISEIKDFRKNMVEQLKEAEKHRDEIAKKSRENINTKFDEQTRIANQNVDAIKKEINCAKEKLSEKFKGLSEKIFENTDLILKDISSLNNSVKNGFSEARQMVSKIESLNEKLIDAQKQRESIKKSLESAIDNNCEKILRDHDEKCKKLENEIKKKSKVIKDYIKDYKIDNVKSNTSNDLCKDMNTALRVIEKNNKEISKLEKTFNIDKSSITKAMKLQKENLDLANKFLNSTEDLSRDYIKNIKIKLNELIENEKKILMLDIDISNMNYENKLKKLHDEKSKLKQQEAIDKKDNGGARSKLKWQEKQEKREKEGYKEKDINLSIYKGYIKQKIKNLKEDAIESFKSVFDLEVVDLDSATNVIDDVLSKFDAIAEYDDKFKKYKEIVKKKRDGNKLMEDAINYIDKSCKNKKESIEKYTKAKYLLDKAKERYEDAKEGTKSEYIKENLDSNIKIVDNLLSKVDDLLPKVDGEILKIKTIPNQGGGDCAVYAIRDALRTVGINDLPENINSIREDICEVVEGFRKLSDSNSENYLGCYKAIFGGNELGFSNFRGVILSEITQQLSANGIGIEARNDPELIRSGINQGNNWSFVTEGIATRVFNRFGTFGINLDAITQDHELRNENPNDPGVWLNNSEISAYLISRGFVLDNTEEINGTNLFYTNTITGARICIHNNGIDSRDSQLSQGTHWEAVNLNLQNSQEYSDEDNSSDGEPIIDYGWHNLSGHINDTFMEGGLQ